jgi:ketosteroid isomerase-like protein
LRLSGIGIVPVVGLLIGCAASAPSIQGDPGEAEAVRSVLDGFTKAFNAHDVDLMSSYIADDARIDSVVAGGKASKEKYREAMIQGFNLNPA